MGFREGRETQECLVSIYSTIAPKLTENEKVIAVFLDIKPSQHMIMYQSPNCSNAYPPSTYQKNLQELYIY